MKETVNKEKEIIENRESDNNNNNKYFKRVKKNI